MVWFLAPTVALADQQCDVLKSQIPGKTFKFICGADDVEAWSTKGTWDSILKGVRAVVSTYRILLDAVMHGFVSLQSLSLIVIDEGTLEPISPCPVPR